MIQDIANEAEQADWQQHLEAALAEPTVASLAALTSFPKRMEEIADALGGYNPGRVAHNVRDAVSVAHALNGGHNKTALRVLLQRRTGFRKSEAAPNLDKDGKPTQPDRWGNSTEVTDALLAHIRSGDPARLQQAKGLAGMVIALSVEPEAVPQVLARTGFKDDRSAAEKRAAARRIELDPEEEA